MASSRSHSRLANSDHVNHHGAVLDGISSGLSVHSTALCSPVGSLALVAHLLKSRHFCLRVHLPPSPFSALKEEEDTARFDLKAMKFSQQLKSPLGRVFLAFQQVMAGFDYDDKNKLPCRRCRPTGLLPLGRDVTNTKPTLPPVWSSS